MQIIIHNIPTEIYVQTIALALNDVDSGQSFLFRCYHCGTVLSRIMGRAISITPGVIPTNQVPVIKECYNCHENYVFQTVISRRKITALTLAPEPNRTISTFHCILCRMPLLQYDDKVIVTIPDYHPIVTPYSFSCYKDDCKKAYTLNEVVSL